MNSAYRKTIYFLDFPENGVLCIKNVVCICITDGNLCSLGGLPNLQLVRSLLEQGDFLHI